MIIIVRQVVPPWGRVFSGSIKVVVMEEEAPYPYEIEVTPAHLMFKCIQMLDGHDRSRSTVTRILSWKLKLKYVNIKTYDMPGQGH